MSGTKSLLYNFASRARYHPLMERITNRVGENRVDRIQEKSVPSGESDGRRSGLSEAAYNKQVTRRVEGWRASHRRRHGDAHRGTRRARKGRPYNVRGRRMVRHGWAFVIRHSSPAGAGFAPSTGSGHSALHSLNFALHRPAVQARPPTAVHPQGSRGAHPAAFARPPTRVHPEGVLLGMPRGARGGPAVSDVQ